jgi:RNA polymerase sigma-70 factor (ECF subfamily)
VVTERKILQLARHWRAEKRGVGREIALDDRSDLRDGKAETPTRILERKETAERLTAALACLPPTDRGIAISRLLLKLPWSALGRTLGISEEAAQMRYLRARSKLRRLLSEALDEHQRDY